MLKSNNQHGFTVVELLITLFIAAAFLVSGYQLFSVIIKDGGEARTQSRAADVAYDYLQRYKTTTTSPCTASTPLNNAPTGADGLSAVFVTVKISCPYTTINNVSKVAVTVKYGAGGDIVSNATYVTQ